MLGLAVLFAVAAIFVKCCRQRVKERKRKALKEETTFQSMQHSMKSMGGDVVVGRGPKVFSSASKMPESTMSDTVPLMAPEYPPEVQTPGNTYHDQTNAQGYG